MHANQLRLYFSSVTYLLMHAFRRSGLKDTELAHAQCDTIRLKLLKIGAQIQVTVRRGLVSHGRWLSLRGGLRTGVYTNLQSLPLRY